MWLAGGGLDGVVAGERVIAQSGYSPGAATRLERLLTQSGYSPGVRTRPECVPARSAYPPGVRTRPEGYPHGSEYSHGPGEWCQIDHGGGSGGRRSDRSPAAGARVPTWRAADARGLARIPPCHAAAQVRRARRRRPHAPAGADVEVVPARPGAAHG